MSKKPSAGRYVLSLGGSIIAPPQGIDVAFIRRFRDLILRLTRTGRRFIIVCGGGATCRTYQAAARRAGRVTAEDLDLIGIRSTALNAELVRTAFGRAAWSQVVTDPRVSLPRDQRVIIGAGWKPGCSSDQDAVLLARRFRARAVVNLSNVAYVYDRDPRRFKSARPIKAMSWPEYLKDFGGPWRPGLNRPFDPVAARTAARAGLKVVIADGRQLANVGRILRDQPFRGTIIS